MPKPKVLALVLAGGEGSRLELLTERRANGRPWDLDRTPGGLRLLPPQLGSEEDGFHEGNADAIWRNRQLASGTTPRSCWSSAPTTSIGSTTARCWPATASGGPG